MGDCNTLKSLGRAHHCDPHLDQTKLNDLLPVTIDGVLAACGNCDKVWQAWTPPVEDVPASQNLFPECQHCAQPSFSF